MSLSYGRYEKDGKVRFNDLRDTRRNETLHSDNKEVNIKLLYEK